MQPIQAGTARSSLQQLTTVFEYRITIKRCRVACEQDVNGLKQRSLQTSRLERGSGPSSSYPPDGESSASIPGSSVRSQQPDALQQSPETRHDSKSNFTSVTNAIRDNTATVGEQLQQSPKEQKIKQYHGRHAQQQQGPRLPSVSLSSHWEVSTGLGWRVKLTNPLKLVFGKPWRKAVPLSILFFASTFIFTMLQVCAPISKVQLYQV